MLLDRFNVLHSKIDDLEVDFTVGYVLHMIDEGKMLEEVKRVLQQTLQKIVTPEYRKEVALYSAADTVDNLKQLLTSKEPEHEIESSATIDYMKLPAIIAQRYRALSDDERVALKMLQEAQQYSDLFEYYKAITLRAMAQEQGEKILLKDTATWLKDKQSKQQTGGSVQ